MYLYIELWKFRPAWLELSEGERKSWMDELLAGLQGQFQSGVEVVGMAANDRDTPHPSGYDFMAVWKMPNKEIAKKFEAYVESSGLHEYYEQVNARGHVMSLDGVVEALLNAQNG